MMNNTQLTPRNQARQELRVRKLARISDKISDLDGTIPYLKGLSVVFGVWAIGVLGLGSWLVSGVLGVLSGVTGVIARFQQQRLKALENEETYLIEVGELDDI